MELCTSILAILFVFLVLVYVFNCLFDIGPWSAIALASLISLIFALAVVAPDDLIGNIGSALIIYCLLIFVFLLYLFFYVIVVACDDRVHH